MQGLSGQKCHSCGGEGTVFRDYGPEPCTSCFGIGELPSASVLCERRLRELEQTYSKPGLEVGQDVRWLIGEVRRAHHALLQILTASQELENDDMARKILYLANDVLGIYPPSERS